MAEVAYRLAVIIGSVRAGRFGPVPADWFMAHVNRRHDVKPDLVDLATLDLPVDLSEGGDAADFRQRIAEADAFVVITPEYNHGYPGGLKVAIDTAREEWHAKPVGFVSYGGVAGGLRSVEGLRLVFAELQAVTIRQAVSFHWAHTLFDEEGKLGDPGRADAAAEAMLDQLGWWARALRNAREQTPYPG
jgi:NAD(P)H-dependent FMN reductase